MGCVHVVGVGQEAEGDEDEHADEHDLDIVPVAAVDGPRVHGVPGVVLVPRPGEHREEGDAHEVRAQPVLVARDGQRDAGAHVEGRADVVVAAEEEDEEHEHRLGPALAPGEHARGDQEANVAQDAVDLASECMRVAEARPAP
jgi:hypothetical protein